MKKLELKESEISILIYSLQESLENYAENTTANKNLKEVLEEILFQQNYGKRKED